MMICIDASECGLSAARRRSLDRALTVMAGHLAELAVARQLRPDWVASLVPELTGEHRRRRARPDHDRAGRSTRLPAPDNVGTPWSPRWRGWRHE
jgi:hypothetical protein